MAEIQRRPPSDHLECAPSPFGSSPKETRFDGDTAESSADAMSVRRSADFVGDGGSGSGAPLSEVLAEGVCVSTPSASARSAEKSVTGSASAPDMGDSALCTALLRDDVSDLSEAGGRAMLLESFGWRREERGRLFFAGTAAGFAPVGVVVEAIVAITALQTRRSPHLAQKFKFCNLQRRSGAS